jgi:ribonuclease HI
VTAPAADVILYTDGACSGNPGPGGWAAILKHPGTGKEKRLSGGQHNTTNNQMEMLAVIRGLEALSDSKAWRVHVVSDSEYVIRGMTEWLPGWIRNNWRRGRNGPVVKNVELWQQLHALCGKHTVTFEHVRGHAGHPENEECDRMAVAAIKALR